MKKILLILGIAIILFLGCSQNSKIVKSIAYKGIYTEKPVVILIMPPINRSTCVEAKEYFHSTLNVPLANAGYYVIPPFLSMEILKKESAYDAELFISSPLTKFGEIFGADLALFTVIDKWDKSSIASRVHVEIEYIFKSIKTNDTVYYRKANIIYSTAVTGGVGVAGALSDIAASAISTASTKYVDVARICNSYTFKDLPAGKYSPLFGLDGDQLAGKKEFKVKLSSKYK